MPARLRVSATVGQKLTGPSRLDCDDHRRLILPNGRHSLIERARGRTDPRGRLLPARGNRKAWGVSSSFSHKN